MTTYLYETIPANPGDPVQHYEIRQSMKDDALTRHPETGEAIRRVVVGGYGYFKAASKSPPRLQGGGCCGGSGCCHQ